MLSRTSSILLFTLFISVLVFGQSKRENTVIAKFDNHKITVGDFEQAYAKNGAGSGNANEDSLSSLKDFLNLYLVYRMKLADGYSKGYDKSPDVLKEVSEYIDQIKNKYYIEKNIIEPNLKRLYERRKVEYRVSHIMFTPKKGEEENTLKLANSVLDSIKNGADFSKMAAKYSQDKYTKSHGGDIYYVTGGNLPISLENAIYSTKIGQIYPKVVKSEYGYHILKVTEIKNRKPKIRVSHILIRPQFNEKNAAPKERQEEMEHAKQIADSVYEKLKAGEDFAKLAKKFSMDKGSAVNGGDIGFFSRNRTVRPFDEAAFNLQKEGDFSGVIQSPFGFHIIKLTGIEAYPSFNEDKDELLRVFKAKQYNEVYNKILDSLRTKYNYSENEMVVDKIQSIIDSAKGNLDLTFLPDSIKQQLLFTENNNNYSVGDYLKIMQSISKQEKESIAKLSFRQGILKIAGEHLMLMNLPDLNNNNTQFNKTLDEYKKGSIIFKLQQKEVWDKVGIDSIGLRNYYNANQIKYIWPDRVSFTELFTHSDSLILHYQKLLRKGANFDTLCVKHTERRGFKERVGHWILGDKNQNALYQKAWKMKKIGEYSEIFKNPGGYSIIRLDLKDPAHPKAFEEAKTGATSDYQEYQMKKYEEAYRKELTKRYQPKIYMDQFEKIYKNNK